MQFTLLNSYGFLLPLLALLCLGALPDLLRPVLWCGGGQALFDLSGYPGVWPCIANPATITDS